MHICPLKHRALLELTGEDRVAFLQGLVSADIEKAAPGRALYGAFLTPQGKFLYDFFVAADGDRLILEVEAETRDEFRTRLSRFRLRSKVALADIDDLKVFALWGGAKPDLKDGIVIADPRLPDAGFRAWLPAMPAEFEPGDWDSFRIPLGLPDGRRDMVPEKTILLEAGFDELHGVDWQKGCFMGQEITARSKYRGQIKRRLLPVEIEGDAPPPGTLIYAGEQEVGEMRSSVGHKGLAVIRLDSLNASLTAGNAKLTPTPPSWMNLD
jgi:folate-binding protein YgfZ